MFSFSYTSDVFKHKNTILLYRMGQKLSSKLLFISSPNADGFYRFHISQGSVATQLKCDGVFSNHFITECASEKILKIGQYLAKIWRKVCRLLFGPPCIQCTCTDVNDHSIPTPGVRNYRTTVYGIIAKCLANSAPYVQLESYGKQGRRHEFHNGGYKIVNSRAKRAKKIFLSPPQFV